MRLIDTLERLFEEQEKQHGLSKNRALLNAGIDPTQYQAYKKANRLLTNEMLERLGKTGAVGLSTEELIARKAIEMFGIDIIYLAYQIVTQNLG